MAPSLPQLSRNGGTVLSVATMLFWKASVWEKYRYKMSGECDTAGCRNHRKSGFVATSAFRVFKYWTCVGNRIDLRLENHMLATCIFVQR